MAEPKTRGLEPGEIPVEKPAKKAGNPTHLVRVVSHGPGWMTVEMGDGNLYRREGGTLAWRNNNVGNIKFGDFAKRHGAIGEGYNDMAVFPTVDHGKKAMRELLFGENSRYVNFTIKKAISIYAPDHENDTEAYINFVCRHAKLSNQKILKSMSGEERERMMLAMQAMEGNKAGKIIKVAK